MDENPITFADETEWTRARMGRRVVELDVATRLLTEVSEGTLDASLALRKLVVLSHERPSGEQS
ncbi:MAG: hypothetical protein IPP16_18300 [Acidimicrobiaceae bacterium]|nr:hypothetical protein [Acidimicrobiaceae bacterium]